MIGDKIIVKQHHTKRAREICDLLDNKITGKYAIAIAGESGSGKSELAVELKRVFSSKGIKTEILQQDDYFVLPPKTNHKMRKKNIEQVSTYEVKLDFLDSNIRSFKRNENSILKPLVLYERDRITTEEKDTGDVNVLIIEGTYTSLLSYVDLRIFINRNYLQTEEDRKLRNRDTVEPFVTKILEKEHEIISGHIQYADIVISDNFDSIVLAEPKKKLDK